MCIPLPTVCNILFGAANTERTNHFSQVRNRGPFPIYTPVFSLVFCFLLSFCSDRAWNDHRLSNFIENVVSITRNPYFIFIGWIPTRNPFCFSIFTIISLDTVLPVTLRIIWRSIAENRLVIHAMTGIRPIAFPSSQS